MSIFIKFTIVEEVEYEVYAQNDEDARETIIQSENPNKYCTEVLDRYAYQKDPK